VQRVPAPGHPELPGVDAVRVDVAGVLAGPGEEQPVQRAPLHQLVVAADVDEVTLIEDRDAVSELEGGPPMRDEQRGPAPHHLAQGGMDLRLDPRVDR
jgi:hypothetical protein